MKLWSIVVCAVLVLGTAGVARANLSPPKDVDARRYLSQGNTYYRLRSFKEAIAKYKAGVRIEDAPVFYYNIAQCYRQWRKYEAAVWYYRRYLGRGNVRPEVEKAVRGFIKAMEAELRREASTRPPTDMAGSEEAKHKPEPAQKPVADRAGDKPRDDDGEDSPTPHKTAPVPWHKDWVGWGITGAGVATGIAAIAMFASASSFDTKAGKEPDQILRDRYRADAGSRRTWGTVFSIASAVAIVAGVVKLAITPKKPLENETKLTVGISRRGIMLSGRF